MASGDYRGSVTWSSAQKPWTAYNASGVNLGSFFGLREGQKAVEDSFGGRRLQWTEVDLNGIQNWNGTEL